MTAATIEKLHPIVKALLKERGLIDAADITKFLEPSYEEHLNDPFLMPDMQKAVDRILLAMERKERIAVYADFDCDGIPGAAILKSLFDRIEYDNIEIYIPNRSFDGYGLHTEAIDTLKERGVKLVITVDLGITAVEAVSYAQKLGMDVIVTDHHELPEELPSAFALINPKFAPYPDPYLCGAGTAFKLVQALLIEGKKRSLSNFTRVPSGWEKWLLDLVAIATIADMVPLTGENRVLARFGLLVLRKTPRPGIVALMRVLGNDQSELTEEDIGFTIGPRINAASKMDETEIALRLLTTKSAREAEMLAVQIEALNKRRKGIAASITREVNKRVKERELANEKVLVLGDPEWKSVMLGPVANSVVKDNGGIVCLWGKDSSGKIKGSCRSAGSLSVVELFDASREVLEQAGGHHFSGGFTVGAEQVHRLPEVFRTNGETLVEKEKELSGSVYEARLLDCSQSLHDALAVCAPFGMGNEKPLFVFRGVEIDSVRSFGKAKEHLEVSLRDGETHMKAIQFFAGPTSFEMVPEAGKRATVLAFFERSVYRGRVELRLRLVDIYSQEKETHATIWSI